MRITLPVADFDRLAKRALHFSGRGRDISPDYQLLLIEVTEKGVLRMSAQSAGSGAVVISKVDDFEHGSVAIPCDQIDKVVNLLPHGTEKVTLKAGSGPKAKISVGKLRLSVPIRPGQDFPPLSKPPKDGWFEVQDKALSAVIRRTLWAMCRDETRPALAGVFLGSEFSVSTDGHMLAQLKPGVMPEGMKVVVPGDAWNKLRAFVGDGDKMKMTVENGHRIWLRSKNWAVFTTLIASDYPETSHMVFDVDGDGFHHFNEQQIVRVHSVHVNRHETLSVVKRIVAASVSQEEKKIGASVSFDMREGELHLVSHYPFEDLSNSIIVDDVIDWAEDSVTADDMSGFDALKGIGLYSTYMKMALESLSSDVICLLWSEPKEGMFTPVQFRDEGAGMNALVMPRRL